MNSHSKPPSSILGGSSQYQGNARRSCCCQTFSRLSPIGSRNGVLENRNAACLEWNLKIRMQILRILRDIAINSTRMILVSWFNPLREVIGLSMWSVAKNVFIFEFNCVLLCVFASPRPACGRVIADRLFNSKTFQCMLSEEILLRLAQY